MVLEFIKAAISRAEMIWIEYTDIKGRVSRRCVDPFYIESIGGRLKLIAENDNFDGQVKSFFIDKISQVGLAHTDSPELLS